jgi:hypothetical protein
MDINDIFEMEHSNNTLLLTPLRDLNNKEYEHIILSYELDIDKFYKVEGKLYPYCYIDNTVYLVIFQISKESFEFMHVRERINQVTREHAECIESENYSKLFVLIDKPFRFEWYQKLFNNIPEDQRYPIFKRIYSSSEYGFNNLDKEFVEEIFKNNIIDKELFNSDIITIYRGEASKSTPYTQAYSWTTDLEVAEWFANRFDSDGIIYQGKIKVADILDYINNNESEVLVLSENIFDIERIK